MSIPDLDKNIGRLLERSAEKYGDKKILHFHDANVSLTYRQMNHAVNQYAHVLQNAGISKGDHLAVMLPNCPEFFLVWFALAKIGAVIVPLNIRYRAEEMVYVLNDSDAIGLVIESEYAPIYREAKPEADNIEILFTIGSGAEDIGPGLPELAKTAPADLVRSEVSNENMMSIQYTSGTTGFPKGCLLTHEYWLTLGLVAGANMLEDDVFLCVEPFYYMDPPWELIACIMKGMTMVAAKSYSPSRYMQLVREYGITVSWVLLPGWIYKQPNSPLDKDHTLRFLLSGAIPKDIHKPFEERFSVPLREGYGMTEIGPGIMMPIEDAHMSGSGSVGVPTDYRTVKIVDEDGLEVSQGEVGELWITGPGIFKGYYNKAEATAEVFEGQCFKTGDLFRQDDKGYYYIVGRKKDMITKALPDDLIFPTDAQKFEKILINLLGNAVEFNHTGGTINITIEENKSGLSVTVEDNGPGIAAGDQEVIFDRFKQLEAGTTKGHRGHGLGLSICWSLTELLNGTLDLDSQPGAGTRFVLLLPRPEVDVVVHAKDSNFFLFDETDDEVETF